MAQSQQYKIVEAVMFADRLGGVNNNSFDLRSLIAELNVFESLDKPYLTGTVAVLDDKAIFDSIQFQGTERLRIKMASVDNERDVVFERTFMMTGIERVRKTNDTGKSSMYLFTLLDEHAFLARINKISKSYQGSLENIIAKIMANEFDKSIDLSYAVGANGIQTDIRCIVPNLTPLDAVKWLTQRITTETGSPFFTYASMHDNNIRLGNLDVMLQQKAFNRKLPYTYNPSNVSLAESQTELEKTFTIKHIRAGSMSNTLKLIEAGAVTSTYSNTNLNTGQIFSQRHSIRKTLESLKNKNIIGNKQNVFDDDFTIGESPVDAYDAKRYHTVTSTGTYGAYKSYNDEFDETKFRKKLEPNAIKNHLHKNTLNVVINGAGFIVSKATVGDIVNINVVNDNSLTDNLNNKDDVLDKKMSGDFLIYETRHTFQGTQHSVSMNICKLERFE